MYFWHPATLCLLIYANSACADSLLGLLRDCINESRIRPQFLCQEGDMVMPHIRKLSSTEVYAVEQQSKCRRQLTIELYDSLLATFSPGDYGEIAVKTSENRAIVRNRLHAAAARR